MAASTARVAVVGAGVRGLALAERFRALGALAAVCDVDAAVRRNVAERWPGLRIEGDYLALLGLEDLDAVALATPSGSHDGMAEAALQAGKDLLVERPLAPRTDRGSGLIALAARGERVLMVGHALRFHPAVRRMTEMVHTGALGRLRYLYADRLDLGPIRPDEDCLHSLVADDLSVLLHLAGAQPIQVRASGGAFINVEHPDVSVVHLTFPSGACAHLHVSRLHPTPVHQVVVIGEGGMLVFDDRKPWPEKLLRYGHEVAWIDHLPVTRPAEGTPVEVEPGDPLDAQCAHFIEKLRTREAPLTNGQDALGVVRALDAARRAFDEDRQVAPAPPIGEAAGREGVQIHATAVVEGACEIGSGTAIWHFSKLLGPLKIGRDCRLGQNVVVERDVTLGDNVKIQNNVSVYSGVILEDDVFCGPSMVFTNVGTPRSAHPRRGQYEVTRVKRGASIGANATVVCGHTLGRFCLIGAGAVVTRDVPDYALAYGNPARVRGWACFCGETLALAVDAESSEHATCAGCGREYAREGMTVREMVD